MPDPILITRSAALRELAHRLVEQPIVAVDTESNSLHAYQEQVCLIQFSIPEGDFLIDPLAIKDLSPLAPLFANRRVEKVFHAAEYDLLCMKRDFGFEFHNLFDTMLASRILGREAFGLGALLEEEFGVVVDKRFQRANWGQRPLPAYLLSYAQVDTHYLIGLRDHLLEELESRRLLPLAQEDFRRVAQVNGNGRDHETSNGDCWRISGSFDLGAQQAAILQELCRLRNAIARQLNRPLFKVMNDRTLLAIAAQPPQTIEELAKINGMTGGQLTRYGSEIMAAIRRGKQAEPVYPPRQPRPDEDFLERVDALRRWRKQTAQEMGVTSDVVLPRDLLYALAQNNPQQIKELAALLNHVPWRLQHFGAQILKVLSKS